MAIAKIINGNDIVNGMAVVQNGSTTSTYDNPARDVHITDPTSIGIFTELNTRYVYHGGPGGSGNWEH